MKKTIIFLLSMMFLWSCQEKPIVPKPPTYPRLELPDYEYVDVQNDCPYEMQLSNLFKHRLIPGQSKLFCTQEVDLGPLNGTLFLFYMRLSHPDSLSSIINFANDKVDEHKIKADKIDIQNIIRVKDKVYGTFFELKGNVATNFQFYLTDSSNHFLRGEILLNSRPNYDSLRPTLQFLKKDLLHLTNTVKWKKAI
jgi:gliding motility-associated lipoprotein GldD